MTTKSTCYPKRSNCDIICPNDHLFDNPPLCAANSNNNIECYPAYLKCTADGRSQTSLERNNDPKNILLQMKMRGKQASVQANIFAQRGVLIDPITKEMLINTSQGKNYTIVIIIIIIIIIIIWLIISKKKL
jgi:hypothetical protein